MNKQNKRFNLLLLDYNEYLFNTINCFYHDKNKNNNILKSRIHVLSHSLLIDFDLIEIPIIKLYFNQNFIIKKFSYEEFSSLILEQKCRNQSKKKTKNLEKKNHYSFNSSNCKIMRTYSHHQNYYQKNYINNNSISNLNSSIKKTNSKDIFINLNFWNFEKTLKNIFTNSEINNSEITEISNLNSNLLDLKNYFISTNQFSNFIKLFQYLNNINDNGNEYICLLIKCDKIKIINRINVIEEFKDESSTYFIITEAKKNINEIFYNDLFYFIEKMSIPEDKIEKDIINNFLIKKFTELKNKYHMIKTEFFDLESEKNEIFNIENKDKINILFSAPAININIEKFQNGLFIIHLFNEMKQDFLCEFIPINNKLNLTPFKFYLNEIKYFVNFRFLYHYKAINLFFFTHSNSKIFEFENKEDFTLIYNFLNKNCKKANLNFHNIKYYTNLWVDNKISNFDYLIYLNIMSSRSFNDISQYPIFPWTLINFKDKIIDLNKVSNYRDLSKPINAINKEKLDFSINNYKEFGYYNKNYISYPFIIYYLLMRKNPLLLLRYQKGNFDNSDKMFISIKDTYENTTKNINFDTIELIPEFYDTKKNSNGDFLKFIMKIDFGRNENNIKINNVNLPIWSNNSSSNFIKIMRSSLESEIVSNKLHLWIDLIFGFKQKSIENYNFFSELRYENCIFDILEKSFEEKENDIENIIEFGQVPIQLFNKAHPKKKSKLNFSDFNINLNDINNNISFQVFKQKQDRIQIEDKYEKERREKENQSDRIKNIFKEKEKNYIKQIKEEKEKINKKNTEFIASIISLMTINNNNKSNFHIYQNNKEKIIQNHLQNINEKKNQKIQNFFQDNKELFEEMNKISEKLNLYKKRDEEFKNIINKLDNRIYEIKEENKKMLKAKFEKNQIIRNLPLNIKSKIELNN